MLKVKGQGMNGGPGLLQPSREQEPWVQLLCAMINELCVLGELISLDMRGGL